MERCLCGIFIVTCVEAAPVRSPGLGSRCASPGRMLQSPGLCLLGSCGCPHSSVPTVAGGLGANCAWWPQAVQHHLPRGGLGKCSVSQPLPTLFPKDVFRLGEQLSVGVCRAAAGKAAGEQEPGACPLLGSPVGWPLGSPGAGGEGTQAPWPRQCLWELSPISGAVSSAPFMCDG